VTLTSGRGPLSPDPAGRFTPAIPTPTVYVEPHPRRIQAVIGGRTVLETEHVLLVHRPGAPLSYAFVEDEVGGLPHHAVPEAPGFVQVPWDSVDEWYEEGRLLVHYPPNPFHRVDCRPTRRRLRVTVGGTTLVDTDDTVILYETALAPKLYVSPDQVRTELLRPSQTTTYCNYKGWTTYLDAVVGDTVFEDVAWRYDSPLPESTQIAGMLSFEPTHAGVEAELPTT